ncbi:hypothetical protein EHQ61_00825 [Leptospira wolffii]|uniref:hypothetical protein n=1 Tax=Leptospira wolffii TaxID=409998 RepID=UPI0010837FC6|nr:hypothetical protein [Leptospira wolffii]TGL55286.1 hypothetical protein EHQ61_00825 [Leptospira wolffii]
MKDILKLTYYDESGLVHGWEIEILDINKLSEYVGMVIIGHYLHVEKILNSKVAPEFRPPNKAIDRAISKLRKRNQIEIEKRDGWIFQIISWIAVRITYSDQNLLSQIPHDAPAQHGLDGIAITLDADSKINKIIITEDKATKYPRKLIRSQVFPEFKKYENGEYDNKIVSRVSGLLNGRIDDLKIAQAIENDIYRLDIRKYRIGITINNEIIKPLVIKKLFKDYDSFISNSLSRSADTMNLKDLRSWMEGFSNLIIDFLETKKN